MKNSTKVGLIVIVLMAVLLALSFSVAFAGNEKINATKSVNMTNATMNMTNDQCTVNTTNVTTNMSNYQCNPPKSP